VPQGDIDISNVDFDDINLLDPEPFG